MTFSNKGNPPDFPLLLNNLPLSRVKSNKHLGLIFNDQITWSDHINYICSKASKQLGLLFKNKKCFNRNVLIKLYKSMILPIIDYGSVIYDNLPLILINKLDNIHRRAAIICSGAQLRTETSKLLEDLGWTRLQVRRTYLKRIQFYKIYVNASPRYFELYSFGIDSIPESKNN